MRYVVVGGGIAGLTAAMHLPHDSTILLESEDSVGGICRTVKAGGFLFDRAGHFLHLRDPRTQALVHRVLPGRLATHARHAAIYVAGTYVPYPFQGHLGWLPVEIRRECLAGYVKAVARQATHPPHEAKDLREWFSRSFGEGITRHFLEPQNRKSYCCALTELEPDWVARFVPQPSIDQVLDGAFARETSARIGYNAELLYPTEGGIEAVPMALAAHAGKMMFGRRVVGIDARARTLRCTTGETYAFDRLVSTMPLNELLAMTSGIPSEAKDAGTRLRSVDVLDIRLGVAGAAMVPFHWIYFPEKRFPFARVVLTSNVSHSVAPAGHGTVQVEINCPSGAPLDEARMLQESVSALVSLGVIAGEDRIVSASSERIACAYVVHDHYRKQALPRVLEALRASGIHSVGRYGGWGYGGMESAMIDGMDIAAALTGESPALLPSRHVAD